MAKQEAKPKPQKESKAPQNHPPAKAQQRQPLPYLLDFSFSLTTLIILFAGVATVLLSIVNGSTILMAAVRGAVAIFGLGAVLWLLNYFLAHQVIQTASKDLKSAQSELDQGESTREVHA